MCIRQCISDRPAGHHPGGTAARLTARRDGANLDVVASIPVPFADWDIARPTGYRVFGSLGDHDVAEFLLILQHD